jgi:hypothetical protein
LQHRPANALMPRGFGEFLTAYRTCLCANERSYTNPNSKSELRRRTEIKFSDGRLEQG